MSRVWLEFAMCVAVIGDAGAKRSRYGDVIAGKPVFSGSWIGSVRRHHVTPVYAITAMSAVLMTGLAIGGLCWRPRKRFFRPTGWVSLALLTLLMRNADGVYRYGQ